MTAHELILIALLFTLGLIAALCLLIAMHCGKDSLRSKMALAIGISSITTIVVVASIVCRMKPTTITIYKVTIAESAGASFGKGSDSTMKL
ncbi:MAG: hypothetical protein JWO73_604 [Candidatus Taylorbacteria bacterium]|nr:hypothetical protein [Candidatus Taylorbacteria bacterium]